MTAVSQPSAPPPPPTNPPLSAGELPAVSSPPIWRQPRWLGVSVAAVALVAGAGAGAFILTAGEDGIDHPEEWDERVVDLVAWVEEERELDFLHPVHVDFLTADEYADYMRYDSDALTDDDVLALDRSAGAYRALGLTSGSFDLFEAGNELVDTGTLAVYSWVDQRIVVRGTEIDPSLEVTLVHELVHALQDQHFDLSRLGSMDSFDQSTALRAIVEGDASLVEFHYIETLPASVRSTLHAEGHADSGEVGPDVHVELEHVPDAMLASFVAPYAVGMPFVGIAHALDGWEGVNRWLEEPPASTAVILAPFRIDAEVRPSRLDVPEPAADEDVSEDGDFGATSLLVMLGTRLDPAVALGAAEAWRADRYLEVEHEGRTCVILAVEGLGERTATRIEDALRAWADHGPDEADATVERRRDTTTLRVCDPGVDVEFEVLDPMTTVEHVAFRSWFTLAVVQEGSTIPVGACVADRLLDEFALEQLYADELPDAEAAAVMAAATLARMSCAGSVW